VVEKYLELGGPYGCPIFDQWNVWSHQWEW
jgi:hypothetical protein